MSFRFVVTIACLIIVVSARAGAGADAGTPATTESLEFFEKQVRPLLAEKCQSCHGAKKQESGLRLDSKTALAKGSDDGPVVTPGDPGSSLLIEAIGYESDPKMPPAGKLAPEAIEILTHWVKIGAPWPDGATAPPAISPADLAKSHWAFQPVKQQSLPRVSESGWLQSPIDSFVLAKLEENGLSPAPPADRRTLIRRASFDLTGLPPIAEDVDSFVHDDSPKAFAKVVDRMLASPQYGERWGRYWLDVARYADTKGYVFQEDRNYPFAYVYRDWVVRKLNEDLPYDQFLIQQIAADRLPAEADKRQLAALGFLTVGRRFLNNRNDIIDDRLDVLCRGTMGLTVTCARCHDHKYDPIPTKDYYALHGVFASTTEPKKPEGVMTLADSDSPRNSRVFIRGNPGNQGDEVPRQFLSVLAGESRQPFQDGSGRLELARAIANRDNPLTARVMVNRVWLHHFGAGLVTSTSNFGLRSDPPSHPELLDYLAGQFVDSGWSLKRLHRLLMLSSAYQQSSEDRPDCRAKDPENRWLWRMNRRRLDFEALRDSLLAAAGNLDHSVGGTAVELTAQPFSTRRTIYGRIDRQNLPGMFRTFDFASPDTHSPQRFVTTVPQQALFLMNSPFVAEQADHLVSRPEVQAEADPTARIELLFRIAIGRSPSEMERQAAFDFIRESAGGAVQSSEAAGAGTIDAWQHLSHVLLMSNEFAFVD